MKHSLFFLLIYLFSMQLFAQDQKANCNTFTFEMEITLPGSTVQIYDAITGDITGWWDHSFSEKPYKLFLEAKPGGGFYEIFDESGDGAKHATVIYAQRGKMIRFDGPLGLAGNALQMVTTYSFSAVGSDSTKITLTVHGSGEIQEGIPAIVESVWHHFLFERFKPYVENGYRKLD